ncbi:MAG: diguanylate cyclase [Anaerolineales bacterium]|nr:diguanylate cyclase [Anaerolineales bacterium]
MPNSRKELISRKTAAVSPPAEMKGKLDDSASNKAEATDDRFTKRDRSSITLEESEVRYRRLFETAKDGILILDGDTGRIDDANPFIQDMLGYSEDELIGKALWEIGAVKDIPASQEAMRQLQKNDYIRYEDIPLQTKAGERKYVEFVNNVYLVNGCRVIQCNIRDITERTQVLTTNDELLTLVNELEWRDMQMQLMNRMNELLQSCVTRDEAYRVISLSAADLFPEYNGCLSILPGRNENLVVVARWGTEQSIEPIFPSEDCWALRLGQIHEVIDLEGGLLCHHFTHAPQGGYFCLPLMVQGETLGVLTVIDNAIKKEPHPAGMKQLAITVGETIKLSLSNLKLRDELRQQAIQDPLTGLFNRRYLDETLPRELNRAQRLNVPLCVVMLDIDGFKQFNDAFGHGPGDSLLRQFADILHEHLRKSDISCRYGGDEFVIVMPDSSIADTQQRMEQIRMFMRGLPQINFGEQARNMVSLSAGIACLPQQGTTASALLRAADEAMYAAKQAGRDRIVVYQKESGVH